MIHIWSRLHIKYVPSHALSQYWLFSFSVFNQDPNLSLTVTKHFQLPKHNHQNCVHASVDTVWNKMKYIKIEHFAYVQYKYFIIMLIKKNVSWEHYVSYRTWQLIKGASIHSVVCRCHYCLHFYFIFFVTCQNLLWKRPIGKEMLHDSEANSQQPFSWPCSKLTFVSWDCTCIMCPNPFTASKTCFSFSPSHLPVNLWRAKCNLFCVMAEF